MGKAIVVGMCISLFLAASRADAPAAVEPVRVCEVIGDPGAWRGKSAAFLGRYSFRENGRFLSEEACESKLAGSFPWPNSMRLALDAAAGPKLPERFDIDAAIAQRKMRDMRKATALGKFRFGSLDYDRWAIVYGRVEPSAEFDSPGATLKPSRNGLEPAPFRLVYRGDGLIFFIPAE